MWQSLLCWFPSHICLDLQFNVFLSFICQMQTSTFKNWAHEEFSLHFQTTSKAWCSIGMPFGCVLQVHGNVSVSPKVWFKEQPSQQHNSVSNHTLQSPVPFSFVQALLLPLRLSAGALALLFALFRPVFILCSQFNFVDQSPLNQDFTTIFKQTLKLLHINQKHQSNFLMLSPSTIKTKLLACMKRLWSHCIICHLLLANLLSWVDLIATCCCFSNCWGFTASTIVVFMKNKLDFWLGFHKKN